MKSGISFSNFLGTKKERVRKTEGKQEEREEGRERKGEMKRKEEKKKPEGIYSVPVGCSSH